MPPSTNGKRSAPSISSSQPKKSNKKARFKTIDVPDGPQVQGSGARDVNNVHVYRSADGRLGQRSTRRNVSLNPAENIFSREALEITSQTTAESAQREAEVSTIVDALPPEQAEELDPSSKAPRKKKRLRADLRAANQVRAWLEFREDFLDELLAREGCHEAIEDGDVTCTLCQARPASVRCKDCFRRLLACPECLVEQHANDLPLHRVEKWTGKTFERTSLSELGLVVQLGHRDGEECKNPSETSRRIVVADVTGVQAVSVVFCECIDTSGDFVREWTQLLQCGWFPATTHSPSTAFTFQLLDMFQELNFQGKTNLFDFWKTIERLTDNTGAKTFERYKQISHVVRLWRHLTVLKRFGRAHDPQGAAQTKPGDLAVECAACPHADKNLPEGWQNAPPHVRWLYTLFLMIDANFRARCKDRKFDPFELAPGWSYYVEESTYQAHLSRCADEKEENSCSAEHSAITKAHLRRDGYVASGIGAVLCARHALVRRNSAGDLQLGEKYANMDFLLFSTVMNVIIILLLLSYDIACQWSKHFFKRMEAFPPEMRINLETNGQIRFAIPKKHFRVHGPNHSQYSLNFLPRVGRTYGEGIESHWSHMNPLALSTREMSLGMRHEVFNDHWGAWNWQKTIVFEHSLLRALEDAHIMKIQQRRTFQQYSSTFDAKVVREWEATVRAWELDPKKPDPYEESQASISYALAKKKMNEEEALEARTGRLPTHEVTPGVFLQLGLELEDQQRALRARSSSGTSVTELATVQEKRNVLMRRIDAWQAVQDVHMPMVASLRAPSADDVSGAPNSTASTRAELVPLWLPSALPPDLLALESLVDIRAKESRFRVAQLADNLDDVRRVRWILAAISDYNRANVAGEGQRAVTRMQDLYIRFRSKERRAVNRYRAARAAIAVLDPDGDWSHTYKPLLDEDLRGPRMQDDDLNPRTMSEGRYRISWIWLVSHPDSSSTDSARPATAQEFSSTMRTEWARSRARAERWEEEVALLLEEMRRVIAFFQWKARWWRSQAQQRAGSARPASGSLARGLAIYAERQALVFDNMATCCGARWYAYTKTVMTIPSFLLPFEGLAKPYRARRVHLGVLADLDMDDSGSDTSEEAQSSDSDSLDRP